jgi:hypothetical protein
VSFFYALLHKSCTIIARPFHFGDRLTAVCYKQKSAGGAVMFIRWNENPTGRFVGDCAVRAVSLALRTSWEDAYEMLVTNGFQMGDMPSSDSVWGATLRQHGFRREAIKNTCPDCYTVKDFCKDYPKGRFLLALDGHVVAVADGNYYDTWDSGNELPIYYWTKGETMSNE